MKKEENVEIYSEIELQEMGFRFIGKHVLIDRTVCFYNPEKISIGNYVRINAFCVISGDVTLQDSVFIGEFSLLFGKETGVCVNENCSIYQRVVIMGDKNITVSKGTLIETQCVITQTISKEQYLKIPMLTVL